MISGPISVIAYILIAGILGCVLAMIIVAVREHEGEKPLPTMAPRPLMGKKELSIYDDLQTVCLKLGMSVYATVPLIAMVEPTQEGNFKKLEEQLFPQVIPFVITDAQTAKPLLAVLPTEFRDEFALSVLAQANLPYLQIGNYNIPGLEKGIRDKLNLPGKGRRSAPPPESEEEEA